jgi:hypothetical protein
VGIWCTSRDTPRLECTLGPFLKVG